MSFSLLRRLFASRRAASPRSDGERLERDVRLSSLVQRHLHAAYRTLRRLGVPNADLEDALQEVIVVLLRRLDDIEPEKERAFVAGVAARVAQNLRRRERRHPEDSGLEIEASDADAPGWSGAPPPSAERSVEHAHQLRQLGRALDAMTEAQRVVFVLFELEELTASEIARELGISAGSVVSRVRRAREVLWRVLGRTPPAPGAEDDEHPGGNDATRPGT